MNTMKNELLKVSVRQNAVFISDEVIKNQNSAMNETTSMLLANASKLGFTFSEPLLHALNGVSPEYKVHILEYLKTVAGVHKNWTPLVKGWDVPTGETMLDHILTFWSTIFNAKNGANLPCGHIIPENTFPLERYNGCPFCGTPFTFGQIEKNGQGSKLKVLDLWTIKEVTAFFSDLLTSKTALDATQVDSLKILMQDMALPQVEIGMKETVMLVIDQYVSSKKATEAQKYFQSPADILRYLWFKKTGFMQIIEPKTIIKKTTKNNTHLDTLSDASAKAKLKTIASLKLKYSRSECITVASWLNNLEMDVEKCCEIMHAKRGMWIRFIRALRLAEYSKRTGFEKLSELLDVFYNQIYTVWQGDVNRYRLRLDAAHTFALLKQRPGLFARSLFANMLWFGAEETVAHFKEVAHKVPGRLLLTLNMYAKNYFDKEAERSVKTLGGTTKRIGPNQLISMYEAEQLEAMKMLIEELCIAAMKERFATVPNTNKTIYIDPLLFNMPVAIGDRSDSVQDVPVALMGTRFPIEGNTVRLYMQWGKGLSAQHMDMDLSCQIAYEDKIEICSYSNLTATGCKHSGDIRSIPEKKGTAEYIEINMHTLKYAKAKYVTFTCNAYSNGAITPNLVVGWMNSANRMTISEKTGVAYDPSCVQHEVRIVQNTTKGLVFGVLDVEAHEIVWLEMTFGGQVVQGLDYKGVQAMLKKLKSKLNIGSLLAMKAEAQGLIIVEDVFKADEVYDTKWAMNAAAVTQLLVD
jgi:hypothetical protein